MVDFDGIVDEINAENKENFESHNSKSGKGAENPFKRKVTGIKEEYVS